MIAFVSFGVAASAGVIAAQNYITSERVVLDVDAAMGDGTPTTIPTDASRVRRQPPKAVAIAGVDLLAPVLAVGIDPETGELVVPDETQVGWYEDGSAPGLPGATVLAAHVSWNRQAGPFHELGDVEPGDTVDVVAADGSIRNYEVVSRELFHKDELPPERVWTTVGPETLVLITCGGSYNSESRRYRENIVVFAVPVGTQPAPVAGGTDPRV